MRIRIAAACFVLLCLLVGCDRSSQVQSKAPVTIKSIEPINRVLLDDSLDDRLKLVADPNWSGEECDQLRAIVAGAYPALVDLYDSPSEGGKVEVKRKIGNRSSNEQAICVTKDEVVVTQIRTINLSVDALKQPSIFVHELAHRFHGRWIIHYSEKPRLVHGGVIHPFHEAVEEGMAQAASNIVARRRRYPPDDTQAFAINAGFNKATFQFRDRLNRNVALYPIRLNLAAWAFERWEAKHPGFLKRFNAKLYRRKQPITYATCWSIAEAITPSAKAWFTSQRIFSRNVKTGDFLYVVGTDEKVGIGLFRRTSNGDEKPLVNEQVGVAITLGGQTSLNTYPTNNDGVINISFDQPSAAYTVTVRWNAQTDRFAYP